MLPSQVTIDRFLRNELSRSYSLTAYDKLLLFFLASYMGSKTECYPSIQSLAIDCSLSSASIKRAIKSLEVKKLINVIHVRGKNNRYSFCSPITEVVSNGARFSETLVSNGATYPALIDSRVVSDRAPNNISNNIRECTSVISPKKLRSKTTTPMTAFPTIFEITESHRSKAATLGLDVDSEFEAFKEHRIAKGSKFTDWGMAFHNWLRKAAEFSKQKNILPSTNIMAGIGHEKL